MNQYTNSIL